MATAATLNPAPSATAATLNSNAIPGGAFNPEAFRANVFQTGGLTALRPAS